ncbi:MAG: hypothetical protein HOA17_02290 [Candidatus Melainabacteria bacterium]|nr:hypothetical protein [Candidatus Melainabacteria bacterium]
MLIKQLRIPSSHVENIEPRIEKREQSVQVNPQDSSPIETTIETISSETVPVNEDLIKPAIKGKTKMDEVAEAAISIFSGRVLEIESN